MVKRRVMLLAAGLLALSALCCGWPAESAAAPNPGGYIAYQSLRAGRWRIVRMTSEGNDKTLLPGKGNNVAPVWLPDGRILFNSDRSGKWQIYRMAADGSGVERLTDGTRNEEHAGVTPDGRLLLVRRGLRSYRILDLLNGGSKPVSFSSFPGTGGEFWPALSPDGTKIAFLFKNGTNAARAVYAAALTLNAESTKYVVGAAAKVGVGCFSAWKPDSSGFLMCIIKNDAEGSDLYFAEQGIGGAWTKRRVTTAKGWDYFPAWSPDGGWILWGVSPVQNHAFESGTYEIYASSAEDPVAPVKLTKDNYADGAPSWSGLVTLP